MKRADWLLLLPCLFLLGTGYLLHSKPEEEFALVTEEVFLSPLTREEQQRGFDTKVTLVMSTRGAWPAWLTTPLPLNGPRQGWSTHLPVYYVKDGKSVKYTYPKGVPTSGFSAPRYEGFPRRYIAHGLLNLSAVPKNLGTLTCNIQVDLAKATLPPQPSWKVVSSAKGSITVRP